MCLSAVYEVGSGEQKLLCEYTTAVSFDGGSITFTDIMGEETVITGSLKTIDLVKNIITVEMKKEVIVNGV